MTARRASIAPDAHSRTGLYALLVINERFKAVIIDPGCRYYIHTAASCMQQAARVNQRGAYGEAQQHL